jgi:hypothetical protein
MATHSINSSHSTLIQGSNITIDTLNVNKTSTQEEIIKALPVYQDIDSSLFSETNTIPLNPPVDINYINNSMFFLDGASLLKVSSQNSPEQGYFLTADGLYLTITGFDNLSSKQVHALYTQRS